VTVEVNHAELRQATPAADCHHRPPSAVVA
jgi:hypothetical protein